MILSSGTMIVALVILVAVQTVSKMIILSTNKISNEVIDKSVDCLIIDYNKLENKILLFVFRLKIIFGIIVLIELHDENYYSRLFYTYSNNRQRICFLMATKCYRNMIAVNNSIIQSITDIYKCCYKLSICPLYAMYFIFRSSIHDTQLVSIMIFFATRCNPFNFCALLIAQIIQTRTRKRVKISSRAQTVALKKTSMMKKHEFYSHYNNILVKIISCSCATYTNENTVIFRDSACCTIRSPFCVVFFL